jgi:hypothetical protein
MESPGCEGEDGDDSTPEHRIRESEDGGPTGVAQRQHATGVAECDLDVHRIPAVPNHDVEVLAANEGDHGGSEVERTTPSAGCKYFGVKLVRLMLTNRQMVTQLISGSLANMQVVFGPWWYEMEPDELRSKLKNYKLMVEGRIAKDEQEFTEFEKLINSTHQILVERSRDDFRIKHNKILRSRNPPVEPIPRLEDLGVITDEMLDDLDRIFLSVYQHPHSHEFGHKSLEVCRTKELAYIEKVSKYLDRYAQREVRGLDPNDYTDRHHRLLRASVIFEIYFTPFTDLGCLPFPTKSMVEALWVALDPYDYAFVEVCGFSIMLTVVCPAPQASKLRGAFLDPCNLSSCMVHASSCVGLRLLRDK